ncbi:polysaccharide biosynthesis/export family protein [Mesorhizobium sp. AR10]|uniref:polysaccharide biosynthesis/export family protein n=1 Tax=Mesorhizobium sp. AR10 TaxID=2865839 RepID=UPI00215E2EC4|nr:polysaccharide biosynthesis/export family protein [Mesorhizobium sp. AR10]UVK40210.1 polysaccharide biosynthesis/export family protein [Mesorhizobium sp. AR10]
MRLLPSLLGLIPALISFCASAQELYRIEANDRIEVWTSVEPSLRRTATIGPDGWLSLPLVGHLKAAGMTAPELEQTLQEHLKKYFKEGIDLTVMLQPSEERTQTVYVTGEVATPGAYPFRPGMIVLHGVSVAGGLQRDADTASNEERIVSIRGEIARDTARLEALAAQAARIKAEIDGKDLVGEVGKESPSLLRERQILAARRSEAAILRTAHEQDIQIRRQAITAQRQQAETLSRRVEIAEHRFNAVTKLVSRGYANEAQALELEGGITELRGDQLELNVDILTTQLELSAELSRFDTSLQERKTSLEVEGRDVERDWEAVSSRLADNNRILRLVASGPSTAAEATTRPPTFSIVRSVDNRPVEFEATERTAVEPGDIIRVGYGGATAPMASGVSTSSIDDAGLQNEIVQ